MGFNKEVFLDKTIPFAFNSFNLSANADEVRTCLQSGSTFAN